MEGSMEGGGWTEGGRGRCRFVHGPKYASNWNETKRNQSQYLRPKLQVETDEELTL